jgi:hypothetical protein
MRAWSIWQDFCLCRRSGVKLDRVRGDQQVGAVYGTGMAFTPDCDIGLRLEAVLVGMLQLYGLLMLLAPAC